MKSRLKLAVAMTVICAVLAALASVLLWWPSAFAAEAGTGAAAVPPEALSWGFVGAAVSTGLAALGAGIAVANVGTAAIGAIAEKPELFGRLLILVGLAEGIAIYGLIVSILILNRLG
jgi:V/A-type H+-transporting ATPase subunit K